MNYQLTGEQQDVVHHPRGFHARVRAVAGSGKTSTMAARVEQLVMCEGVNPRHICVLMFNRLARQQFEEKLKALPLERRPRVNTFHSFASRIINDTINRGLMPPISDYWIEDKEEQVRRTVHTAIRNLIAKGVIEEDSVDPEDALECIGLWKASLIPPEFAGHRVNRNLPLIYAEFERLRLEANAATFDDFVPLAVGILEMEHSVSSQFVGRFDTIIVDEYQDVNLSQQTLVQLLAGRRADVMVVGDDDQTIYEWRGARPSYFTQHFVQVFSNKPTKDYTLSTTFRFGPLLAQSAQNVIEHNTARIPKPVIAFKPDAPSDIHVYSDTSEQPTDVDKELAAQIKALVRKTQNPKGIIVLARLFFQLTGLEAQFLIEGVPYRVVGQKPFYERRENVVLFNYLKLGLRLCDPIDDEIKRLLLDVANVPNRKLTKDMLRNAVQTTSLPTLDRFLAYLGTNRQSPATEPQQEKIEDLHNALTKLHELITGPKPILAGDALRWLVDRLNLAGHYDNYYGKGESSEERKGTILAIGRFADQTRKNVPQFLDYLKTLDTTQGLPDQEIITMTTIFREKGREYDYVILPSCTEGMMPFLVGSGNPVYDTQNPHAEPESSSTLDNERRLFYVAITRAKKAVYIGTSAAPAQGRQGKSGAALPSRFLEELQLDPTRTAIKAMQSFGADRQGDMGSLINACRTCAGQRSITENLVKAYLPRLQVSLPADVMRLLDSTPSRPFAYKYSYDGAGKPSLPTPPAPKSSAPKWWERD